MAENVLCIAAHPDDEVLGCGGALARHQKEGDKVAVIFVADGEGARQQGDDVSLQGQHIDAVHSRKAQAEAALKCLAVNQLHFLDFPDNQLDSMPLLTIVQAIEVIMNQFEPTILYTHHSRDLNVDHQLTAKAALTAGRPLPGSQLKRILGFEVLSSTGWADPICDAFLPQYFVDISETLEQKKAALRAYASEMREFPHARSFEAVCALAKTRGAMIGREYAEAFTLLREIR